LGLEDKLLLTAEEVAALLGLSRSRVYELLYAKAIVSVKIGKSRRIRRTDLEQFVASLEDDE
jgi:excisionase family DNA binding protein